METGAAAQLACLLEVSAPKPGNVSPGRHFGDLRYEDFLASAAALGRPMSEAAMRPIGATVRLATEASMAWTRSNANLGIVLLFAPLARAAHMAAADDDGGGALLFEWLRRGVRRVLDDTTVDDSREVYTAIRLAAPGGLGRVETQDVAGEPTLPLAEVMRLAADRDAIAREYATGFAVTFDVGAPTLLRARADGLDWDAAVVETFLTLLAAGPDTHIARRGGSKLAGRVTEMAASAIAAGGVRTNPGRHRIAEMDRALRDEHHHGNPGTTADLTAAAIFVVLLAGGWREHAARDAARGSGGRAGGGDGAAG